MRDVMTHRGPDDQGMFINARAGRVGFGHRRLSIVDVASGHQPMTNEGGTLHIIYNGEIYNHAEFRSSLEAHGHKYNTHCDTETILHLYEEYGEDCLDHLRGMFAFAIWDNTKRELFSESVRLRLMSDVPLGMFLSGGIDSSAIAAVMSALVAEPIKTFSVAFVEREANELHYARLVARAFRTDHREVVVSPEDFFAALPQLVWHEDEPIAHPSSVALYFVSRLASQHVKVVLTGEGSDELLAGYARYRKTILNMKWGKRYHQLTPARLRNIISGVIGSLPYGSRMRQRLLRTFLTLPPDIESMYFDNFAVFPSFMQDDLLTPETRRRIDNLDPYSIIDNILGQKDATSLLDRLL